MPRPREVAQDPSVENEMIEGAFEFQDPDMEQINSTASPSKNQLPRIFMNFVRRIFETRADF